MKDRKLKNVAYLLFASVIWGAAFVAQRTGGDEVGAYSFNCVRTLIGAGVLVPVIFLLDRLGLTEKREKTPENTKLMIQGGIVSGTALCVASNLQQVGITLGSSVGKAGFLTACYIVLVPICGIPLKKKCSWNVAVGVLLAVIGLYLLCMDGGDMSFTMSDILLLLSALAFAFQILAIDHYAPLVDTVKLSCIQFLVCGVLTIIPMVVVDVPAAGSIDSWLHAFGSLAAWIPILYAGICSCGIAYTLQVAGQRDFNPTIASLVMSLESAFSVLFGWVILGESMSARELFGCAVIFAAVIAAQL